MTWEKIKNFVLGGGAAVVLIALFAFADWRAQVYATNAWKDDNVRLKLNEMIDNKLAAQDLATDSKIVSMDAERATNKAATVRNREEIDDNERRVEEAFRILTE